MANKYRVSYNFDTGKYDVIKLEDMTVVSSAHDQYLDARSVMDALQSQ